jgi:hypothetical protein
MVVGPGGQRMGLIKPAGLGEVNGLTAREKVDGLTAYLPSGSSILSGSTSACNSGSNN